MRQRRSSSVRASFLACALVIAANSIARAAPEQRTSGVRPLLEVPYLTQTGELCGGAALAMVLRYWGSRDVFSEDFAPLLDRSTNGIPVDALAKAARDRGGAAIETREGESTSGLRTALDQGRPAITLIQDTPTTYHYVVVVARTDAVVIFHDPARAPFRVMSVDQFDRVWSTTGRWMLVVLPTSLDAGVSATPPEVATTRAGTCDALVAQNVVLAGTGHRAEADAGLTAALELCAGESSVWRELAGLRFVESKWAESSRLAREAVRLAPHDEHAWTLVATSEFLQDHRAAALKAWNRVDQPHVDLVTVESAERTRHPVIVSAVGLHPRELLTADRLDRAARRLDALPVAASTELRFQPGAEGRAAVQAVVVERAVRPRGLVPLGALGASALVRHELFADVAGPTGSGELWSGAWRWSSGRPRVSFRLAMPAPNGLRGIATIDAWWERESYRTSATPLDDPMRIVRRSVRASLTDWAPHQLRWHTGAALDRIDARDFIAIDGLLDKRFIGDRMAVGAAG
ncbi:MAG: C39 family peptidase, partial [Vicinamibacterales bacterium]